MAMQVTELENTKLKRSLKIVVDAKRINDQLESELKSVGERVRMPGFRPGNIPMKVLKARYGKTVQADVLKEIISQSSNQAMVERKIRPAIRPDVQIEDYSEGGDLAYTLICEVFPEVPEMKFDNITLDRTTFDIVDSDIDEAAARLAKFSPTTERAKPGSKAKMGQVVQIDFKGMIDGKAFDGGTAEDFRLELGSKQFIDTFEEQLVGAKEGDDIIVTVTFPKEYGAQNLAGKEANFAVKVKEIYDNVTPTIDDEFAKARGFADMKALREAIRAQLVQEYDQVVRRDLKKQLFDVLEEKCGFELPEKMIEMEFQSIWERVQKARAEGDPELKDRSEEELKEEYHAIAHRRVKLGLFLADIGQRHKLQTSGEEVNRAVMQQASQFPGQEKRVIEYYQKNPEAINDLRGPILEEKAVDLILAKVKYNDKKATLKEIEAMVKEENEAPKTEKKTKTKKKAG
jgi:trigger factor